MNRILAIALCVFLHTLGVHSASAATSASYNIPAEVLGSSTSVGSSASYSVESIVAPQAIVGVTTSASYEMQSGYIGASGGMSCYTVDASARQGGSIAPSGQVCVDEGAAQVFTLTPDTGATLTGILVDGVSAGTANPFTLSNVTATHAVEAVFGYVVTPVAGSNGSISPVSPQIVDHGLSTAFTVVPDAHYSIDSVTGCSGSLAGTTYTTGPVTADCTVVATFRPSTPGELNLGFGTDGKALADFGIDFGRAVVRQADGKYIVVGGTDVGEYADLAAVRFNADGSVDSTYGNSGRIRRDFAGGPDNGNDAAIQPDGKLVIVGDATNYYGYDTDIGIVRYNTDGTLDTGFGSGGIVTRDYVGEDDHAYSVLIQPDGRIVVAGQVRITGVSHWIIMRFNSDGSVDGDFGIGGSVTRDGGAAYALGIQADGRLIAAGELGWYFALERYTTDGTLDSTFGNEGTVMTAITGNPDSVRSIAIDADGRILAGGWAPVGGSYDFALARYLSEGTLDSSFGVGGILTTDIGGGDDFLNSLAVQPDGRIVATGQVTLGGNTDIGLLRYLSDGTLDTSFGTGGIVSTDVAGGVDVGNDVVLAPDGALMVGGYATIAGYAQFALIKYEGTYCLSDADGDGMSDCWETLYGLNPSSGADASLDGEKDGISNLDEFRMGTAPNMYNYKAITAVGSISGAHMPGPIEIIGSHAYVADAGGLHVIDVSNPASPVQVAFVPALDEVRGLAVSGNFVYLADSTAGMRVIDVTNPASPVLRGTYSGPGPYVYAIAASGSYVYIRTGWDTNTLKVINVSNPDTPMEVGSRAANGEGLVALGNYVYGYSAPFFVLYGVSNPSNPTIAGSLNLGNVSGSIIKVSDGRAYLAGTSAPLTIVDVSVPSAPVELARHASLFGDLDVVANVAYIPMDNAGVYMEDVTNPVNLKAIAKFAFAGGHVKVSGNYAYVTPYFGTDGLRIYRINPLPWGGNISIDYGASSTQSSMVHLDLSCHETDGSICSEMQLSNDGTNWSAWEPFVAGKTWTLSSGTGLRTVSVRYRNGIGTVSDIFSDTITAATNRTVSVSPTGMGMVAGSGINCPGDCSEVYADGSLQSFTASPGSGWIFDSWNGSCADVMTPTCTILMDSDRSVDATFILPSYIDVSTNVDATFTLTGPDNVSGSAGPTTGNPWQSAPITPGSYTICFDVVPGHLAPPCETQTLVYGTTLSFAGSYASPLMAVTMGPAPLNPSRIRILDGDFSLLYDYYAFDAASVMYGARVAFGDVDGDGHDEVIATKGEHDANNAEIKAFEIDGTPLAGANLVAFSTAFKKGARVAAGDFDVDGKDEIIIGTSEGQALVRVFSYNTSTTTLEDTGLLLNAYGPNADGVNVAASDVDGDMIPELVTSPASKTELPSVKAWVLDTSGGIGNWTAVAHPTFAPSTVLPNASGGGSSLAGGSDLFAVGTGASGGRFEVYTTSNVYDCSSGDIWDSVVRQRYGIELSVGDIDADGSEEIIMTYGQNPGSGTEFHIYGRDCGWEASLPEVFSGAAHGSRISVGRWVVP